MSNNIETIDSQFLEILYKYLSQFNYTQSNLLPFTFYLLSILTNEFNLAREVNFRGNEPLLLTDPQVIWLVESGTVSVFAVTVRNGRIDGDRRFLFSCESGEFILGTMPNQGEVDYQLLALPMGKVDLLELNRNCIQKIAAEDFSDLASKVDCWLKKFDTKLFDLNVPAINIKAGEGERISLDRGEKLQSISDKVTWLQVNEGILRLLGIRELIITEQIPIFPLPGDLWIEAGYETQLATKHTADIVNLDELFQGLNSFHQHFLFRHSLIQERENRQELTRLSTLKNLNQQAISKAVNELSSPLRKTSETPIIGENSLLIAAGAVGRALGVTINPPARGENWQRLQEPLEAIARSSRLRIRQVLLRDNWWEKDCGPLIGYIYRGQTKHPVALLPKNAQSYEMYDASERKYVTVDHDIVPTIEPVAYMFYRSFADKALSAWDVQRFAFQDRGKDFLAITISSIAVTLLGMLTPLAMAMIVDSSIPDSDRFSIIQIGLGLIIAAIATALFSLTQGFALLRIESTSDANTQSAMWDRLLNLPVSFFRNYSTGDLLSRTNSVSQIRRQIGSNIMIKMVTSVFALLNLGLLLFYSLRLALLAIGAAIVIMVVTSVSGSMLVRKVRPLLELEGHIFGRVVQLINGVSKLRVAGAEQRAFAFWSKDYSKQIKLELSTQLIEDLVAVFNTVMPVVMTGILFAFTVFLLNKAQAEGTPGLTTGKFLAFNTAFATFLGGATQISDIVTDILQIVPQWKRAQPIVKTLPEVELSKAEPEELIGRIKLDRISFRYHPDLPLTLDNVSIDIEPGEFIALVGSSGSGKSTILRLLLGFETPEDGSIYYDGQDISGLNINAVRRQLGVVLQNGTIMSGSIFDNLAGGAKVTIEEAWTASRMAGFDADIESMPMGMHTVISEGGGNLSGGQRQRLLIAKALILKPRILFFDEATSALDNRTQAIVSENLESLQVTRVVIAHRLSTIRNADRIYVLDKGRIMQQGSFDKLLAQPGIFANLMRRQMT